MAQTSLNGTCDDATVVQMFQFTEDEPDNGVYFYTDTGNVAAGANGRTAGTVHNYMRLRLPIGTQIFSNVDLAPAHRVAVIATDTYVWVEKLGYKSTPAGNRLYKIGAGAYAGDYVQHDYVEILQGA